MHVKLLWETGLEEGFRPQAAMIALCWGTWKLERCVHMPSADTLTTFSFGFGAIKSVEKRACWELCVFFSGLELDIEWYTVETLGYNFVWNNRHISPRWISKPAEMGEGRGLKRWQPLWDVSPPGSWWSLDAARQRKPRLENRRNQNFQKKYLAVWYQIWTGW